MKKQAKQIIAMLLGTGMTHVSIDALAQPPIEKTPYILPKIGAIFDVDRHIFGMAEQSTFAVIATGPDFVIYHEGELPKSGKVDRDQLFIEFSGIYWSSCSEELPDINARKALASLWPLEKERQTDFSFGKINGTFSVKPKSLLRHKNRKISIHWVEGHLNEGRFRWNLSVALKPGYATPLAAKWEQNIKSFRYEAAVDPDIPVRVSNEKFRILSSIQSKKLGTCKRLFE